MAEHNIKLLLSLEGYPKIEAAFKSLSSQIGKLPTLAITAGAALTGLGGALSTAGFIAGLKNVADLGGKLSDIAAQTDISADKLLVLRQAFKDSGVSVDAVQTSVSRLSRALVEAQDGSATVKRAFDRLGVSVDGLLKLKPEERFAVIQNSIAGLSNDAERAQVAMALFGRSGSQLITLFRDSSAFEKARRELGGLVDVVGGKANEFDAISDALGNLSLKSQQLFGGILYQLEPQINAALDKLIGVDLTPLGMRLGEAFRQPLDFIKAGEYERAFNGIIEKVVNVGHDGVVFLRDLTVAAFNDINWGGIFQRAGSAFTDAFKTAFMALQGGFDKLIDGAFEKVRSFSLTRRSNKNDEELLSLRQALADELRLQRSGELNGSYEWGQSAIRENTIRARIAELEKARELLTDEWKQTEQLFERTQSTGNVSALLKSTYERFKVAAPTPAIPAGTPVAFTVDNSDFDRLLKTVSSAQTKLNELKLATAETDRAYIQIAEDRARIDKDFTLSNTEKYRERKALLADEQRALNAQIDNLRAQTEQLEIQIKAKTQLRDLDFERSGDEAVKAKNNAEIEKLTAQLNAVSNRQASLQSTLSLSDMRLGADPTSFYDQMNVAFSEMRDAFQSWAVQARKVTLSIGDAFTNNLSPALTKTIIGAQSLEKAFENVGMAILEDVVGAIVQAITKMIVFRSLSAIGGFAFGGGAGALGGILGFADGGRVAGGEQLVRMNENGSEYIVSSKSPASNDKWLNLANQGFSIDNYRALNTNITPAVTTQTQSAGVQNNDSNNRLSVSVSTHSEFRDLLKRAGAAELVHDEFKAHGWA